MRQNARYLLVLLKACRPRVCFVMACGTVVFHAAGGAAADENVAQIRQFALHFQDRPRRR